MAAYTVPSLDATDASLFARHSKQRTYKRKQAKDDANDASLSEKILERYGPARDAIDALGEEVAAKSSQKKAKTAGTEAFDTAAAPEVGQKVEVDFDGEKRIGTITEVEAGSFQFAKDPAGAYKELALYNISIRFGDGKCLLVPSAPAFVVPANADMQSSLHHLICRGGA